MNATGSPAKEKRWIQTRWPVLTIFLCLVSFFVGRYTAWPKSAPDSERPPAPAAYQPAVENLETVEPYGPIITRSEGDYTPELIRRASHTLNGYTLRVHDLNSDRRPSGLFRVSVMDGAAGTFLEKDGAYVQVDSGSELIAINEILMERKFTRQDFDNSQSVESFLDEVIWLHSGTPGLTPCTSLAFERMRPPADWLRGTEKDEAVLRELCEDPKFTFHGDVWSVVFNVIRSNGAVDRWRVVGEHNPQRNTNEIWGIRRSPSKPPGTFSYPIFG